MLVWHLTGEYRQGWASFCVLKMFLLTCRTPGLGILYCFPRAPPWMLGECCTWSYGWYMFFLIWAKAPVCSSCAEEQHSSEKESTRLVCTVAASDCHFQISPPRSENAPWLWRVKVRDECARSSRRGAGPPEPRTAGT